MKLAAELEDVNLLLQEWSGASAYIQAYHASLGRLAIRLYLFGNNSECYLVAAGCRRIRGPFRFVPAHLMVTREEGEEGGPVFIVRDQLSGFELTADGGVVIVIAAPDEIGVPFEENWLGSQNIFMI